MDVPLVEQYRPERRRHTYSFFHDFLPSSFTCRNPWISGQLLEFRKFCAGKVPGVRGCTGDAGRRVRAAESLGKRQGLEGAPVTQRA